MRAGHFKEHSSCSFLAKSLLNSILPALMAVMLTSCMDMVEKQKPEDVNSDISAIDLSARTPRPVAASSAAAPSGKPFSFFGFGGAAAPAEKAPASADAPVAGGAVADGDGYALNFDNAPVADVAKVVLGDVLGLGYSIDPRVQGIVNLSSGRAVPKGEILYVFENALRMADIGLVKSGSLYRLVPVSDRGWLWPLRLASPLCQCRQYRQADGRFCRKTGYCAGGFSPKYSDLSGQQF